MKNLYLKVLLLLLVANTAFSQVNTTSGTWSPVGDVTLTTVYDDADNGDGIGDGAIFVDGNSATGVQGAIFTFGGVMDFDEELNVSIYTYNRNNSFVKFRIQLFNATTNTILVTSQDVF